MDYEVGIVTAPYIILKLIAIYLKKTVANGMNDKGDLLFGEGMVKNISFI